jgi:hypothetical protein
VAYHIHPAEQAVWANVHYPGALRAKTGDALNPESITVLDPALADGHSGDYHDVLKGVHWNAATSQSHPRLTGKEPAKLDIDDRAAPNGWLLPLMKARPTTAAWCHRRAGNLRRKQCVEPAKQTW